MGLREIRKIVTLTLVLAAAYGGQVRGAALVLPGPEANLSLQYGDFHSYSLPLLQYLADNGFIAPATYNVQSTAGIIKDGVVIGTGSSGTQVNQNFAGMNDAYPMASGSETFQSFTTTAHPGSFSTAPMLNPTTSWNADVAALQSFLATGGGDFVILFNLNETGTPALGDAGLASTDLLAWADMTLSNPVDVNDPLTRSFFFSAFDNPFTPADERTPGLALSSSGGPEPDPAIDPVGTSFDTLDARWGIAHSALTVDPVTGALLGFGPVGGGDLILQNLGANQAAFAVYNAELDALIKAGAYQSFSLEFRSSRINNGFEQIFLLNDTTVTRVAPIPEPGSLAVWALLGCVAVFQGARCRRATMS